MNFVYACDMYISLCKIGSGKGGGGLWAGAPPDFNDVPKDFNFLQ